MKKTKTWIITGASRGFGLGNLVFAIPLQHTAIGANDSWIFRQGRENDGFSKESWPDQRQRLRRWLCKLVDDPLEKTEI